MSSRYQHSMPFGAEVLENEAVRFHLWAPTQHIVHLILDGIGGKRRMEAVGDGWFECIVRHGSARDGGLYHYELADGTAIPDPASRYQPNDVHGPSEIVDGGAYRWRNQKWFGRQWSETVLYELHVGCFGEDGSFDAVRRRLDHLSRLGITAIELMPLADFEGKRNWGYDGVLPFAPDSSYGRPEDLKRLIDEAHDRGLMTFIDVVYNHFGPSGNYLNRYASTFFTEHHQTPWGAAINFDDEGNRTVRDFFIHNALYWLEEFRFDGLRFDAVHAIKDDSKESILDEIAHAVREYFPPDRQIHLVLENDDNIAQLLERDVSGQPRLYTAQWNDDFHHCAHVLLTGESAGYYADYTAQPIASFGRVLSEGFVYQGEPSPHRQGRRRGEPSADLPPTAFVSFLQNHDQVGNRAFGERLSVLAGAAALDAMHAVLLLSPEIPMLFMGEEWATRRPFLFFCDFRDEMATAVRDGRRREFARFPQFQAPEVRNRIPDPNSLEAFEGSRLDWVECESPEGRERINRVRALLDIRKEKIIPLLATGKSNHASYATGKKGSLCVCWWLEGSARMHLLANLADSPAENLEWTVSGDLVHAVGCDEIHVAPGARIDILPPWSVIFSLEQHERAR